MPDGQWIEFEDFGQGYDIDERGAIWISDQYPSMEWKSPGDYSLAKELGDLDYEGEDRDDGEDDDAFLD